MDKCAVPPGGWWCSREAGHEGPCAARRATTALGQIRQLCANADGHVFDLIAALAVEVNAELSERIEEGERLRAGLELARNRLRAAAINEAPKGTREYYEYSEWADAADAALSTPSRGGHDAG